MSQASCYYFIIKNIVIVITQVSNNLTVVMNFGWFIEKLIIEVPKIN